MFITLLMPLFIFSVSRYTRMLLIITLPLLPFRFSLFLPLPSRWHAIDCFSPFAVFFTIFADAAIVYVTYCCCCRRRCHALLPLLTPLFVITLCHAATLRRYADTLISLFSPYSLPCYVATMIRCQRASPSHAYYMHMRADAAASLTMLRRMMPLLRAKMPIRHAALSRRCLRRHNTPRLLRILMMPSLLSPMLPADILIYAFAMLLRSFDASHISPPCAALLRHMITPCFR